MPHDASLATTGLARPYHERQRRLELPLGGHLNEHGSAFGAGPFEFLGVRSTLFA